MRTVDATYTIGELADLVEVPTSTVRYYERVKLLRPTGRTDGNHRYYGEPAVERLRFIRAAQRAGFTLEDIATLLELRDGSLKPCAEVRELIEDRLDKIAIKMADFRRVQKALKADLALCRSTGDPAHCGVIAKLSSTAASVEQET